MTATEPEPTVGYIRGGTAIPTEPRHVLRILLMACLAALAILTVALTVQAARDNSRHDRLQSDGVAVQVRVTRCLGVASGTGITVASFTCYGNFVLDGQAYNDVIGGSTRLHSPGDVVAGVVDPRSPSTLATARSVAGPKPAARSFRSAAISAAALLLVTAIAWWCARRPQLVRGGPIIGTG